MANLGSVSVNALWDGRAFNKGIEKSKKVLKGMKAGVQSLTKTLKRHKESIRNVVGGVGAGLGGLVALADGYSKSVLAQNRFSAALGLTSGKLQGYQIAASKLNIEQDTMNDALLELSRRSAEATTGSGSMFDALQMLNIEVETFSKMKLDKQFDLITRALSNVDNTARRNFLTDEIFGGASDTISGLLPQINELAKGFDSIRATAANDKALEFANKFDSISKRFATLGRNLLIDVAPAALEALQGAEVILKATGLISSKTAKEKAREASGKGNSNTLAGQLAGFRENTVEGLGNLFSGVFEDRDLKARNARLQANISGQSKFSQGVDRFFGIDRERLRVQKQQLEEAKKGNKRRPVVLAPAGA